jgi:hypothetical protein
VFLDLACGLRKIVVEPRTTTIPTVVRAESGSCALFRVCTVYLTLVRFVYRMEPALAAIRGHSSAHSLATGPDTADPFISPLLLTMTPALSSK